MYASPAIGADKAPYILNGQLNLVKTPDFVTTSEVIGQFLLQELKAGKTVGLISSINTVQMLEALASLGFSFNEYLENEQLYYFYYKADFSFNIALSQDYSKLFDEIKQLTDGKIQSLAIMNFDFLINQQSAYLTMASLNKFVIDVQKANLKILTQYSSTGETITSILDDYSKKLLTNNYEIKVINENKVIYNHSLNPSFLDKIISFKKGFGYAN